MPMEQSHVWLGRFQTESDVQRYFEEVFDESDEDREHTPINRFAADQGETFLDHDWVEHGFRATGGLRLLIARHSYSDDYIELVIDRAKTLGIQDANTFILADQGEISNPRSVEGDDYQIWYIGVFRCNTWNHIGRPH